MPHEKLKTWARQQQLQKWRACCRRAIGTLAVELQQCFAGPGRRPENHPQMCRGATSRLLSRASAWCNWAATGFLCSWRLIACSGPMAAGGSVAGSMRRFKRRVHLSWYSLCARPVHALVHNVRASACVQMCACKCVHVAPTHRPSRRSVLCDRRMRLTKAHRVRGSSSVRKL